jgi:hypothetical protein
LISIRTTPLGVYPWRELSATAREGDRTGAGRNEAASGIAGVSAGIHATPQAGGAGAFPCPGRQDAGLLGAAGGRSRRPLSLARGEGRRRRGRRPRLFGQHDAGLGKMPVFARRALATRSPTRWESSLSALKVAAGGRRRPVVPANARRRRHAHTTAGVSCRSGGRWGTKADDGEACGPGAATCSHTSFPHGSVRPGARPACFRTPRHEAAALRPARCWPR